MDIIENDLNARSLITDDEVLTIFRGKLSRTTLWRYRRRGILPYVKIGEAVWYKWADIVAWMNKKGRNGFDASDLDAAKLIDHKDLNLEEVMADKGEDSGLS